MPHDLLARIEALEAERGILRTLHRYGHTIDYGLHDEWVGLFTEDGIWELRKRVTGDHVVLTGRAELAAFIVTHTHAPGRFHRHLLSEPVIEADADHATVESFFTRVDAAPDGEPYLFSFGRYVDRLRRCQDGVWRFEKRIAESDALSVRDRP